MKPIENIRQEIEDIREQLLSLDEEIWGKIEHRSNETLGVYIPHKERINEHIEKFQKAADDLLAEMAKLAEYGQVEIPLTGMNASIAPPDRSWAFLKPLSLEFENQSVVATSWSKVWQEFLKKFLEKYPDQFRHHLVESPCIAGVRNEMDGLQKPFECGGKWFECGLSANTIRDRIKIILIHSRINTSSVKAILRGNPDLADTMFDLKPEGAQ